MKRVGKISNSDSNIALELNFQEIQILRDALCATGYKRLKECWISRNPSYTEEEVSTLTSEILTLFVEMRIIKAGDENVHASNFNRKHKGKLLCIAVKYRRNLASGLRMQIQEDSSRN